ncbi:hypothetical protein [Faecalimicrobium dakarense]|uniref:hypothetical protein n=1 Tax=Faecalimicrobium dakarense TaxID=1301100 RepID=UPI0004B3A9A4|nr:hypothetical protein [[Clostridium] dakarense]
MKYEKMISKKTNLLLLLLGIFLFLIGLYLIYFVDGGDEFSRLLTLIIALGGGLIGGSTARWYRIKRIEKIPNKSKEIEIEYNDERNTLIRYKAKSISGEITNWIFVVVAYVCIVKNYPLWLIYLILGIVVSKYIFEIIFIKKYNKEL